MSIASRLEQLATYPYRMIIGLALCLTVPLFFYYSPTLDGNDFIFYKLLLTGFSHQLWQGDCYPRWYLAANDGLGSPVFLFYGPVAYYLSSLLEWLHPIDTTGIARYILSMMVARIVTGCLCFLWLRNHCKPILALMITVLFITIPYSVHIMYVQTSLSAIWAFCWMFAILMALDRLIANNRYGFTLLALMSAVLLMTHLPTYITFSAIPLLYICCMAETHKRWQLLVHTALAQSMALGLSALYWLPMVMNKKYVQSDTFTAGRYHFSQNFLNQINEFYCMPYFMLVGLVGWQYFKSKARGTWPVQQNLLLFMSCVTLAVLFLIMPISLPLWELLPPLQFLQFPFRFLSVALLPFAFFAGLALLYTKDRALVLIFWVGLLATHLFINFTYCPHNETGILQNIAARQLITPREYLTIWSEGEQMQKRVLAGDYDTHEIVRVQGNGQATLVNSTASILNVTVTNPEPVTIIFNRLYFPGITITDMWSQQALIVEPTPKEGLLSSRLTAGEHSLQVRFGPFAGENEGKLISLLTCAFMGCVATLRRRTISAQPS